MLLLFGLPPGFICGIGAALELSDFLVLAVVGLVLIMAVAYALVEVDAGRKSADNSRDERCDYIAFLGRCEQVRKRRCLLKGVLRTLRCFSSIILA